MSKKTTKSSKQREGPKYEGYVSNIVRQMEEFRGAVIERNRRFEGVRQPGKYEIDLSVILRRGSAKLPIRIFIIFECKHHRRRIDRPLIQKFVQTRDAISADKAIFVSPVGYTKEATQVADAFGVERWIIRPKDHQEPLKSRLGGDVVTKDMFSAAENVFSGNFAAKQFLVPAFELHQLLEPFHLYVENEYETNMPKFPVKLGVIVTAKFERLKDIESYLNRRQDVPKLMKDTVDHEVRRFLHSVDPERFYMRFSHTEPEEEEPAIEQALRERIEARLVEKFKADVIDIVFRMRDTEITQVWSSLEKSEGTLEIKLPSFSDVEGVTYRGRVRVEAIHGRGWNRFRTSNPEMDKICRRLEEHVLAQLGTFANADLVYTHLEGQRQVGKVIEALVKKFAVEEFGLVIRVSIRCDVTAMELDEKTRIPGILDSLKDLERERTAKIGAGVTDETIKKIEERYQKLLAELRASVKATRTKFTRPELIEPSPPTRLADVLSNRQSIGGAHYRMNAFEVLSYDELRLKCLADLVGYEPALTTEGEQAKALTKGTPAFELSNLVLAHLSKDVGGRSIISQWKNDQRKRLEKYGLPQKPLNGLLQAVIDGNEEQFDALRSQLPRY